MQLIEREYSSLDIDEAKWRAPKPFGISGCIRVRNDGEFLKAAVLSHLPYLDEIVLAYQPSEDNTLAVCDELEAAYPKKVRIEHYPVAPVFVYDRGWKTMSENSIHSFVYMSNWATTMCRYSWVAKFEADVVCLPTFERIVNRVKAAPDKQVYYGRVILNVVGREMNFINAANPRNAGWDEAVFMNCPDYLYRRADTWEYIDFHSQPQECFGWSAVHLKRVKRKFTSRDVDVPIVKNDPDSLKTLMDDFNRRNCWPGGLYPEGDPALFDPAWREFVWR